MATQIAATIGSGGTYATWATAEAALPASTIVSDEVWTFTVLGATASSGATVTGTLMDVDHSVTFKGSGYASHPGQWGCTYGGSSGIIVSGASAYVYLTDVAFFARNGAGCVTSSGAASVVICTRVICYGGNAESAAQGSNFICSGAAAVLTCNACMSLDAGTNANVGGFVVTAGTGTFNNCTNLRGGTGFARTGGTAVGLNCYSYGAYTADYAGTWTLTTCYSSDTTANSVGGAGNAQEATPNFIALRDSRICLYGQPHSWNDTAVAGIGNTPGKRGRAAMGMILGRNTATTTGDGANGTNGDSATAWRGWTGTTGFRFLPASAGTMSLRIGSGDRSIGCILNVITAPITDAAYGWANIDNRADANDTLALYSDSSGYITCTITDGDGDATTATSTIKVSTLTAGQHFLCGVLSGNTLTIYIDGTARGTGDATGKVTFAAAPATIFHAGRYNGGVETYIGANMSVANVVVYGDDVLYSAEIPYIRDGSGWIDNPIPTAGTPITLQKGGTAAGTPSLDLMGVPFASLPSIGCLQYVPNRSGDTHNTGYGLQTHSLQPSNTGFLTVTK